MKRILFILVIFIAISAQAQIEENSELFLILKEQDSIFFEEGFNQCNIRYLEKTVSEDLKFFHDQSGFQDRKTFFENVEKNLCSNQGKKPIRKLEKGSLEVFPLFNNGVLYGAIQRGIHNFYLREAGKEDLWTGTAKFTHVWILENDTWKLSEVLSYDHQNPPSDKQ